MNREEWQELQQAAEESRLVSDVIPHPGIMLYASAVEYPTGGREETDEFVERWAIR